MNNRAASFVCLALSLLCFGDGYSQRVDTVEYRRRSFLIDDSTVFNYQLGSIGIMGKAGLRFLAFQNPIVPPPDYFFTTETFTIAAASDSVTFARFASFHDKDVPHLASIDTADHAALNKFAIEFTKHYFGRKVFPAPNLFASNSTVKYILEECNASDNSVIAALDTLTCFVNAKHQLRFWNSPPSHMVAKAALRGAPGLEVYLHIRTIYNTPATTAIRGYNYSKWHGDRAHTAADAYVVNGHMMSYAEIDGDIDREMPEDTH